MVNLGIINHVRDSDRRLARNKADPGEVTEPTSRFLLVVRLKVEASLESYPVSQSKLFEPREPEDDSRLRPKGVLIWGRAGMGKTTLCKKIVNQVSRDGLWKDLYDRVIGLPLRRLQRIEIRTNVELLEHQISSPELGEWKFEAIDELVQDERALFLLNGSVEVSLALEQDSNRDRILYELLSRSHVSVTSRPHSTRVLDH